MSTHNEAFYTDLGNDLIAFLGLKVKKSNGRIDTAWGDKTPEGLARSIERFIEEHAQVEQIAQDLLRKAD